MARFPRPQGTIENYADIKIGDVVWHVFGFSPNCAVEKRPHVVVLAPIPYKDHPKWSKIHEGSEDDIVFDTEVKYNSGTHRSMHFVGDGNLTPGRSHNDNYWCRTKEAAEAAAAELRCCWTNDSKAISQFH